MQKGLRLPDFAFTSPRAHVLEAAATFVQCKLSRPTPDYKTDHGTTMLSPYEMITKIIR